MHERRDLLQRLPGKEVRGHEEGEAGDGEEDNEGAVAAEREEGRPTTEGADGRDGQEEEDSEEGEAEEALYGAHGCRGEGGHAEVEVLGALRHDLHVEADAVVHADEGGVEPEVEEEGDEDGAEESFEDGAAVFVADGVQVREVDEEDEDAGAREEEVGEDVGHENAGGADDEADCMAACFLRPTQQEVEGDEGEGEEGESRRFAEGGAAVEVDEPVEGEEVDRGGDAAGAAAAADAGEGDGGEEGGYDV